MARTHRVRDTTLYRYSIIYPVLLLALLVICGAPAGARTVSPPLKSQPPSGIVGIFMRH